VLTLQLSHVLVPSASFQKKQREHLHLTAPAHGARRRRDTEAAARSATPPNKAAAGCGSIPHSVSYTCVCARACCASERVRVRISSHFRALSDACVHLDRVQDFTGLNIRNDFPSRYAHTHTRTTHTHTHTHTHTQTHTHTHTHTHRTSTKCRISRDCTSNSGFPSRSVEMKCSMATRTPATLKLYSNRLFSRTNADDVPLMGSDEAR
jgi:hypothetical protein